MEGRQGPGTEWHQAGVQTTLSTGAGRHTWVGGMHPPHRCRRALKGSQAHESGSPFPHGLCQGLQVASHQGEEALQVLLQPAGHLNWPFTPGEHPAWSAYGEHVGSETRGALNRTSWPAMQPAASSTCKPACTWCLARRFPPVRLTQHQAKCVSSAEVAVTSLGWAASAATYARPSPSKPGMAPWHCVCAVLVPSPCWCCYARAQPHGQDPAAALAISDWPALQNARTAACCCHRIPEQPAQQRCCSGSLLVACVPLLRGAGAGLCRKGLIALVQHCSVVTLSRHCKQLASQPDEE